MKKIDEYTFRNLLKEYPHLTEHSIHFCSPFLTIYFDENIKSNNDLPYETDNVYLEHRWGGIQPYNIDDEFSYNPKLIKNIKKATEKEIQAYKLEDKLKLEAEEESRNNEHSSTICGLIIALASAELNIFPDKVNIGDNKITLDK